VLPCPPSYELHGSGLPLKWVKAPGATNLVRRQQAIPRLRAARAEGSGLSTPNRNPPGSASLPASSPSDAGAGLNGCRLSTGRSAGFRPGGCRFESCPDHSGCKAVIFRVAAARQADRHPLVQRPHSRFARRRAATRSPADIARNLRRTRLASSWTVRYGRRRHAGGGLNGVRFSNPYVIGSIPIAAP
jgi:hypothetical protein